ncbi:MAG: FGGY-family carbohydrate kinase [Anaerolineae bacterium]|nr:FGGY-family carbohydrate kinase [Anaerolineae bacterium]
MKDHVLAFDAGTQSVRALLFDLKGNLVARARVPIEPYFSSQPGWAEQQPEVYWDALTQASRQLWATPGIRPEMVAGLALTTQRGTVINVDRAGRPLRPAIVWLDQRTTRGLKPVGGLWGLIFRLIRMRETIAYLQAEAEANWIRTYQPDIWAQTHKLLLLSGYLTHRLTGRFVDSVACQVAYIPFDYRALRWAAPGDWKWQAIPMDRALLPDLAPPGEQLGELSAEAAAAAGLPAGLPVIAAAADKACEMLGSGCIEPHVGCLGYGTTATFNVLSRKYLELVPFIPPYPGALPGAYSLEFQVYRGYWMVSWFKAQFGHREQQLAAERGVEVEALFDELVNEAPPGAMGLMLQPYWTPGLKAPGREAKGAVVGFGDVHTRAHMYRAILEGVAYALREGKERCERRSKIPVTALRVSGGGSQSDAAMQITADVFGLPAERPHTFETSGLGAAIEAAVGLKLHPDFGAAVRDMTRTGRVFEPNLQAQATYDALYRQVYQRMYGRLQPLYQAIRDITGYPPPAG